MTANARNLPAWVDVQDALAELGPHRAMTQLEMAITLLVLQAFAAGQQDGTKRVNGVVAKLLENTSASGNTDAPHSVL